MMVPLYKGCEIKAQSQLKQFITAHKGLWFERFFNQYTEGFSVETKAGKADNAANPKIDFLKTLFSENDDVQGAGKTATCGDSHTIRNFTLRQKSLIDATHGKVLHMQSSWHFVTGMGQPHPVENGLLWHSVLGTPYLPASSVKGLLRSWFELHELPVEAMLRMFGSDNKDATRQQSDQRAGDLVFFDAFPLKPVKLIIDTMTPHMGKWYEKGGEQTGHARILPADWHSPVPVPFLAAKELLLQFAITSRMKSADSDELIDFAMEALKSALIHVGAGAKTAAGYGHMILPDTSNTQWLERQQQELDGLIAEKKAEALRESMSPEQRYIEIFRQDAKLEKNKNAGSGADFHRLLIKNLKNSEQWPPEDAQELAEFVLKFFKQNSLNKKTKEARDVINKISGNG